MGGGAVGRGEETDRQTDRQTREREILRERGAKGGGGWGSLQGDGTTEKSHLKLSLIQREADVGSVNQSLACLARNPFGQPVNEFTFKS